jgi:PAS domain S-box-containing protein
MRHTGSAAGAAGTPPEALSREMLAGLVAAALDGLALLDDNGRYLHVNPVGCRILGIPDEELRGKPALFPTRDTDPGSGPAAEALRTVRWCPPGAYRERELEFREVPVRADGIPVIAVAFRDVSEMRLQQRRFTAFASAAANVAEAGLLRQTLNAICAEVVRTTDLAAAQILLIDAEGLRMRVHGAAPAAAWPENFTLVLEEARRRGAELASVEAMRTKRPVVHPRRKTRLLADAAWEPLHDQFRGFAWETFASVPLLVHGSPLGALNVYYRPGQNPDADDIPFLCSMADQAAVAVENARLLAESRGKAATDERQRLGRELHDSACQQLFSMTLHIRAAQLTLPHGRPEDKATRHTLETLDQLAHAALEDMRALIFELYPRLLHTEGLLSVVRQQAASAASRIGMHIAVEGPAERLEIDSDAELDAYRLIQEALHNCVKHSEAKNVRILVGPDEKDSETLMIEVADDGIGFDPSTPMSGLGLLSMHHRAERLGGELLITSSPGAGTLVRVVAPRVLRDATNPSDLDAR